MPIITLTTDLGLKDFYSATLKGSILKKLPQAQIIDISHQVEPFNIVQAAFILKNAYIHFPDETIHIALVNAHEAPDKKYLIVKEGNHYFIGPDNGIFSLVFENQPELIWGVQLEAGNNHAEFTIKDYIAETAASIASGAELNEIGNRVSSIIKRTNLQPVTTENMIRGTVIYIDGFENVLVNINKSLFSRIGSNRRFNISFKRERISELSHSYNDVPEGEMLCLFNSWQMMEIAINKDKAGSLLGLHLRDTVQVDFFE